MMLRFCSAIIFTAFFALGAPASDWLIDGSAFVAAVKEDGNELTLSNDLIQRTFRTAPNGATVAFDNVATRQSLLRGVKPEALVTIDGVAYEVDGPKRLEPRNHTNSTQSWALTTYVSCGRQEQTIPL